MPPALRAHVFIPVFRGAYAPRYEYAAPVGALFSVTYVRLQLVTIVFPILTSMAEKSRPQVFIPAGAVKW